MQVSSDSNRGFGNPFRIKSLRKFLDNRFRITSLRKNTRGSVRSPFSVVTGRHHGNEFSSRAVTLFASRHPRDIRSSKARIISYGRFVQIRRIPPWGRR